MLQSSMETRENRYPSDPKVALRADDRRGMGHPATPDAPALPIAPGSTPWRKILNGIFYITRSGCSWRMLPHDLPHWKTVYHYFRLWRKNGLLQRIHDPLREKTRVGAGRLPEPSAGILEGQTVRTPEKGRSGGGLGGCRTFLWTGVTSKGLRSGSGGRWAGRWRWCGVSY
ncbi:hypothetical protein YIM1640_22520 [Thermus oshimai]|jgi:transposase